MTCQIRTNDIWDSTPIGKTIDLYLYREEQFSPQLILEDKVLRSVIIHLRDEFSHQSQIQFIGTLISDDESQRLTYVIDHLLSTEFNTYQMTLGEFLVPILLNSKNSKIRNKWIENGIKEIELYCHSSSPIELHRFFNLCGQLSSCHPSSIDLSFDLLMIKNGFILTPINADSVRIISTISLENPSNNRSYFGYCSLDQISQNQIFLISENDSQACTLPLIGIWISGNVDIQSPFVWAICLRYCRNVSLIQRLRSGMNSQESFLLVCYPSTSFEKCILYEVYSTSLLTIDYDLWTCSKLISMPNSSFNQCKIHLNTEFPYDFQFKRVYHQPKHPLHIENHQRSLETSSNDPIQAIMSSPNTNGSLFGIPRIPPKQSIHRSPTWDTPGTTPINTPRRTCRTPKTSPKPSPRILPDHQWKEEFLQRMTSYESQIQSLTTLITQLFNSQQTASSTPVREHSQRDVAIQSESPSPTRKSMHKNIINQNNSHLSKIEHYQPILQTFDQSTSMSNVHQKEKIIDYSSLRRSSFIPTDVNPVDILKPIFRFIDHQQQKRQQRPVPSLLTTCDPVDPVLFKTNNEQTENMVHLTNVLQSPTPPPQQQQQQQQQVTSTTTTGINFISNGVQMQFINQQSSTTMLYPTSQSIPPPSSTESLPISPQRSENSLSVEVHGLEMKYLEDDQLAAAIEYRQQSETPQVTDKSLSFGTREYLQRYGLFTDTNSG